MLKPREKKERKKTKLLMKAVLITMGLKRTRRPQIRPYSGP